MPGIPREFYYPALAALLWLLVVTFIPKAEIRRLFWLSFLWGYLGSKTISIVLSSLLHLYQWQHAMPFQFLGVPHWLVLGWAFSLMLYFYFLPKTKEWYAFPSYLFAFALASAALDRIFNQAELLKYLYWGPFYRFIIALVWFYGAARHYNYLVSKGKL